MKIVIVGYNCSGKSVFSEKLSYFLDVPIMNIDDVYYDYNVTPKIERNKDAVKMDVISFINENDSWVMDGGYDYTGLYECCDMADYIIFMRINRVARLVNLCRRCKIKYNSSLVRMHRFFRSLPWMLHYGCGKKYDANNYSSVFCFKNKLIVVRAISKAQKFVCGTVL